MFLQEKNGQQKEFYRSYCLSDVLNGAGRDKQRHTHTLCALASLEAGCSLHISSSFKLGS